MPSTKIDDGDRLDLAICESKRLLEHSRTLHDAASGARAPPCLDTGISPDDDDTQKESPPRWAGFF